MIIPGSSISYLIPARLADVRLLGISARALFTELTYDSTLVFQLELAIIEASNNIVLHAYQEDENKFFNMNFLVKEQQIQCTFIDQGIHKDFLNQSHTLNLSKEVKFLRENRRGVGLICTIMDEVNFTKKGKNNILTLRKYLPSSQHAK